jgi:hypothetical protein
MRTELSFLSFKPKGFFPMHHAFLFPDEVCPKFDFGQINLTPGVLEQITPDEVIKALARHLQGDWGTMDAHDVRANENALLNGGRIFSGYNTIENVRFWIITEADRSYTTILLPQEY